MIAFVLLCTVLILGLVEYASRREDLRRLQVTFSLDTQLTEPGETATLRYTVRNTSAFPLLYAGLTLSLEPVFTLREDEAFTRRRVREGFEGTRISHSFYLGPRQQFTGRLRFSVKKRGYYTLGRYYLESGDFLGLRPALRGEEIGCGIICTAAPCSPPVIRALGGELGLVSVRRFLQDDPSMVLGYRDYTGREPMKQISWNQSARAGRLIVRQNDFTTDRAAAILVNMDPSRPALMERCLSLTASVCRWLEREKIPYSLQSNGDLFSLKAGLGSSHLFFIERRIGLSRLTGYTGFPDLIDQALAQRRSGCTYIVLTPFRGKGFPEAVGRLARHTDQKPIVICAEEEHA